VGQALLPNHSAFRKGNDARVILSNSKNAVSISSARAQRTVFRRRDVRQQSRLFVPENQWLKRNPSSNRGS
jgi:hypothetical protein